jgi:E3 ubiquitin-protein ligase HUWE1
MAPSARHNDRWETISASQLLVELRKAVIGPAQKLWAQSESSFMDKATTSIVKSLIEIIRLELDGDSELGAITRTEKVSNKPRPEPKKWTPKSSDMLDKLAEEYGRELATEALFRCYDNNSSAREYCLAQKNHPRFARTPIPADEVSSPSRSRDSPHRASTVTQAPSDPDHDRELDVPMLAGIDSIHEYDLAQLEHAINEGLAPPERVPTPPGNHVLDRRFLQAARAASASPAQENLVEAGQIPGFVTVDDLQEDREKLKENLIDRCLDILNVHDDVTFELSDLIAAALHSKAGSQSTLRQDIGSTLLLSLTSLQSGGDLDEQDARAQNKKIASYAHFLALVLQDGEFYEAIREELNENFPVLVDFIKLDSTQKSQNTSSFIGQVLLILERLLTDDATPQKIDYNLPDPDKPVEEQAIAEFKPGLISDDEKSQLFQAILTILPHIGKDDSLALSVCRVLVVLTRNRALALRLGETPNIGRLFTMAKQLHGVSNDRLQSTFLLILRHVIEDDETIRNIMRSEVQAIFENRSQRQLDTTSYTRTLYHLALRSPQLFVEVTNEKVKISNYSNKHIPQQLTLKRDPPAEIDASSSHLQNGTAETTSDGEKLSQPAVNEVKEKSDVEKSKSVDMKMPVVDHSDGVIHYILGELLGYKDVEDSETTSSLFSKAKDIQPTDVEMTNGQSSSSAIASATPSDDQQKKPEKAEYKAENHPIYIYRCFLLQCLTELLSCYNRTKVEFINFKRKADPQGTTPSKPRSFVLNYLLNSLIPTGTLSHAEDIASRKRSITSSWAMSVVVSLCSKTGERGYNRPPREFKDYEEEPDLLFVRKFVLEHAIRSFRDAQSGTSEGLEQKYSRLLNLADLFHRMLTGKPNAGSSSNNNVTVEMLLLSQGMLAKIMYEKNFISALTSSIADIDLNFPGAKRAVKYILRPLKYLTKTANELSAHSDHPVVPGSADDEISSDSDLDDSRELDDTREETPDLFRNSALGLLDPGREEDTDSEDEEDDDDEEMYEDEYADEMDYEEEMQLHDHDEVVSDEEAEIAEMGPIEGLPGDIGMDIEVEMGGEVSDGDDMSDSDDDSDDMDEDDEDLDEDVDDMEELEELEEGVGGSIGADDEDWGTEEGDGEDYPGQDEIEDDQDPTGLEQLDLVRVLQGGGPQALLQGLGEGDFDVDDPQVQDYIEEEMQEEGMQR